MTQLDESEIKKALGKKAAFGSDIDLDRYDEGERDSAAPIEDLADTPDDLKRKMINVGVDTDDSARSGTILFMDNGMTHCSNRAQEGVIIEPTRLAFKHYPWIKDYYWKAVDPAKDKYTAKTYEEDSDGYFIYVKPGYHLKYPVQTCMMLGQDRTGPSRTCTTSSS